MDPLRINKRVKRQVAVVGGGTAGVMAALGAKNAGAEVVLIEKNAILGGTMTQGMVCCPGLFHAWGRQIIGGYGYEAVRRTLAYEGRSVPTFPYKSEHHYEQQIGMNPFFFATVLDGMCEECGVDVRLGTFFIDARQEDGKILIYVADKEGLTEIAAEKAVDASGDAYLAQRLGYGVLRSRTPQPSSLRMSLGGYDAGALDREEVLEKAAAAIGSGRIADCSSADMFLNCLMCHTASFLHTDVPFPDTSEGYTKLQSAARRNALGFIQVARGIKGCENAFVADCATECGVRETCRIVGEYEITVDDYVGGRVFDDAVCHAFYPVDLHLAEDRRNTGNNLYNIFLEEGVIPTVPYRALIPKGSDDLLCAGRIVCSDQLANSGLRVEATCMAEGQAAGVAAAIAAKRAMSVKDVPYAELCESLKEQGAIVPKGEEP